MTELVLLLLRIGFLVLLWFFVFAVVYSLRADLFGVKVRKLPDPTPYIALGTDRYKGGNLAKAGLMGASRLNAAIDDGILDIQFKVTGFSVVFYDNMGNAVQMASVGDSFTDRMRDQFRRLSRGRRFYITEVKAVGPDGIARTLPGAMEIKVR